MLDYQASVQAIADSTNSKKRKAYCRWSDKDRFQIRKYAAVHGTSAAAKKCAAKDKPLNESSARRFSVLYKEEIKKAKKDKRDPKNELAPFPKRDIPSHLVMNLDQISLKYVPAMNHTMAKRIHPQSQSSNHLIKEVSLALSF